MPHFDIVKKAQPARTFRVASVMGAFDLQTNRVVEHFVGDLDLPENWSIGLIVGNSGTGKTTIAKTLFPDAYIDKFNYTHETILDDMPKDVSMSEIEKAFNSVGFSSPPSWLKPYAVLSNGEKMRCDLARAMLSPEKLFVFDEFTSVVDRNVAKVSSFAIQKAIRRNKTGKQFIAVTCHFDVEEWLNPDWVFNTNDMTFHIRESQKKNRPALHLRIYETDKKREYWKMFSRYHYLNDSLNIAARVFIATINDEICAFVSVLHFPHPVVKNLKKAHRIVVLPDYQGIGLGMAVNERVGDILKAEGNEYAITTSSPAFIHSMKNSTKWVCTHYGRMGMGSERGVMQNKHVKGSTSGNRVTASFKLSGGGDKHTDI